MWQLDDIHELLETDETLTCIRQGRGVAADVTYVDGLPTATHTAAKFEITCTIQPMGGRDLMLLPEAFRSKDMLACWQAHRTVAQDVVRLDVADLVLFRGTAYQVQGAEDWESYTKATLCAVDVGAYAGTLDPTNLPDLYPATPVPLPPTPPAPTEELDMDIGPLIIQAYYNPGDVYDFRTPGDGANTFRYYMPRGGVMTGYTVTGQAPTAQYGCYVQKREAATGQYQDVLFMDPAAQPTFNQDAGEQVVFATPLRFAKGDQVILKRKIDGNSFGNIDIVAMMQITLDAATST